MKNKTSIASFLFISFLNALFIWKNGVFFDLGIKMNPSVYVSITLISFVLVCILGVVLLRRKDIRKNLKAFLIIFGIISQLPVIIFITGYAAGKVCLLIC